MEVRMAISEVSSLIWNMVGVIAVLSLSCIVSYVIGHGNGYEIGVKEGKQELLRVSRNIEAELMRKLHERKNTRTQNKRRNR